MTEDTRWLDSMPEYYDRCLGPGVFAPFAQRLADIAAAHAPQAVLEIAAGTGIVTAELVRVLPTAQITATDLNPAMVAWAAQRVSGPTWLPADAQCLQFRDGSFDMIVCQFGVMFFPDKAQAFAEVARVLCPDGLFVFTAWDTVDTSDLPAAVVAGLAEMFTDDPPSFLTRIPHGYHEADRIRRDVVDRGAGGREHRPDRAARRRTVGAGNRGGFLLRHPPALRASGAWRRPAAHGRTRRADDRPARRRAGRRRAGRLSHIRPPPVAGTA
ncbi:MAG TPA: class I SAM-dependent methyltransferase [Jatrophihabitantaceae bacterium]|jgi:SAM-dependent methyltransferase